MLAASGSTKMLNSATGVVFGDRHRNVGERLDGAERDRLAGVETGLDDHVDGVAIRRLGGGRRQIGSVDPGRPVDVLGGVELTLERSVGAAIDGNVGTARQLAHRQRVHRHQRLGHVSCDRGDRHDVELR